MLNMKNRIIKFGVIMGILLFSFLLIDSWFVNAPENSDFSLIEPVLADSSTDQIVGASFLLQDAGISAYISTGQELDLSRAKSVFRTIEKENDEYIIGSVPLPDLDKSYDVHCYIQKDGRIIVYYLKEDPTSKILGNKYYADMGDSNNLKDALDIVCGVLDVGVDDINYYHFQYPTANKLMKITGSKFKFKVPDDLEMYETSFAVMAHGYSPVYILRRSSIDFDRSDIRALVSQQYGKIDLARMNPDEFHDVDTGDERGSILLLYREP